MWNPINTNILNTFLVGLGFMAYQPLFINESCFYIIIKYKICKYIL